MRATDRALTLALVALCAFPVAAHAQPVIRPTSATHPGQQDGGDASSDPSAGAAERAPSTPSPGGETTESAAAPSAEDAAADSPSERSPEGADEGAAPTGGSDRDAAPAGEERSTDERSSGDGAARSDGEGSSADAPRAAVTPEPSRAVDPDAPAPDASEGEDAAPSPPLLGAGPDMPPSTDPAGFPPARVQPGPRPYLEVHGFAALWLTPLTDTFAPHHATDSFRIRWAFLRVDAHPTPNLHVLMRLNFALSVPLFDLQVTWTELPYLNVTFGQFRQPFGASATTLAPRLVMLDRPSYVYAMTPRTFRDVGLMFGSGEGGLWNGFFHYRLSVTSGTGRMLVGNLSTIRDARDLLYTGRVMFDAAPLIKTPGVRLVLGGTLSWTRDQAVSASLSSAEQAAAVATTLGRTWTPFTHQRETMLAGADLTFSGFGFWAQAEWMYLESRPTDGAAMRRATAGSLELAYTLPWRIADQIAFQLAARGELVEPDFAQSGDEYGIFMGGLNILPWRFMKVSVFGSMTAYQPAAGPAGTTVGGELSLRATVVY